MTFAPPQSVKAILGPTNTGKTYFAIERMLAHPTGMIGLPLRLLAREVYQRCVERVGEGAVALVTGEERIVPPKPRFWVCTVEAMPMDIRVDCVAIDEIQTAIDFDRGHVFTDRILNARGSMETLLLGAATMAPIIRKLLPHAEIIDRPRFSQLTYAGSKKISRQPARSAIVAFSASMAALPVGTRTAASGFPKSPAKGRCIGEDGRWKALPASNSATQSIPSAA